MATKVIYNCDLCGSETQPVPRVWPPISLQVTSNWQSDPVPYLHGHSQIKFVAVARSGEEPEVLCCRPCLCRLLRAAADATEAGAQPKEGD